MGWFFFYSQWLGGGNIQYKLCHHQLLSSSHFILTGHTKKIETSKNTSKEPWKSFIIPILLILKHWGSIFKINKMLPPPGQCIFGQTYLKSHFSSSLLSIVTINLHGTKMLLFLCIYNINCLLWTLTLYCSRISPKNIRLPPPWKNVKHAWY
jgi:hypothetical protein